MRKDNQQMIDEYFNSIKDKYPGLTREECAKCCVAPFDYAKQEMEGGELPTIRFKYLGTLVPYPKRVVGLFEELKRQFTELKVDSKTYLVKKQCMKSTLRNTKIYYEF